MNPEIKTQWVAALRSGEFEQGVGALNKDGKFCCLGVLCDLAAKAGIVTGTVVRTIPVSEIAYGAEYESFVSSLTLPQSVMNWAGLDSDNPDVARDGYGTAAAYLNDSGTSFAVIADLIEANL